MTEELKPCPHCGGEAKFTYHNGTAPKVKALEWDGDGFWSKGPDEGWMEEANTPFGSGYIVELGNFGEGNFTVYRTFCDRLTGFESPDEAKAAAQADYERRVLECLATPKEKSE